MTMMMMVMMTMMVIMMIIMMMVLIMIIADDADDAYNDNRANDNHNDNRAHDAHDDNDGHDDNLLTIYLSKRSNKNRPCSLAASEVLCRPKSKILRHHFRNFAMLSPNPLRLFLLWFFVFPCF